jgi:hypothetical protein
MAERNDYVKAAVWTIRWVARKKRPAKEKVRIACGARPASPPPPAGRDPIKPMEEGVLEPKCSL